MSTCTWQNWANLLDYVKLNLGADSKSFEFDDEQMMEKIQEHTLPEFSRYVPLLRYYFMLEEVNAIRTEPTHIYQFKNFKYKILKVSQIMTKDSITDINQFYSYARSDGDITDFLMGMNMAHMGRVAMAPNTWKFIAPDKIEFIFSPTTTLPSRDFITEVACVHENPTTVNPDMYMYLRDLALADMMIFIGRIRTKFRQFSTPFGQVDLNADDLLQEGKQLKAETVQALKDLPPEDYIFFLN